MATITTLSGGRGWLRSDAAASIARIDKALGHRMQITSAGRSRAEQQRLYDLYLAGKGNYAAKPGTSPHESGYAIDSDEAQRHLSTMSRHGWSRPLKSEPWHFLYRASNDTYAGAPAGGTGMWDVEKRQRFLNQIGLDTGGVGNGWGPASDKALKTFQTWMGLDSDGDWGAKTQGAAEIIMAGKNFTNRPVKEIQAFLKAKGLYPGAIDNAWGNGTSMGTYRYQKSVGLTADAQWGSNTDAKAFPPAPKPDPVPPTGSVLDPAAPWKKQTPDSGLASWVGSPNYNNSSSGQGAKTKTHIDHHWFGSDASLSGTDAHFQNPGTVKNGRGTGASSQYGIGADGTVHQYVLEKDYAHTNGTYEANATGITIEHEGGPGKPVTEATIQKSAELHADIARRHGWAKLEWMVNVFPHKHYVATQCPGTLPSEEIIRRANLLLNPAPGTVVVAKTELMALRAQIESQQKALGVLAATVTEWLS